MVTNRNLMNGLAEKIAFVKNNMIDLIPIAKKIKENEIEKEKIDLIEFTGFIRTNKNTYIIKTNNIFKFEKQLNKLLNKFDDYNKQQELKEKEIMELEKKRELEQREKEVKINSLTQEQKEEIKESIEILKEYQNETKQ